MARSRWTSWYAMAMASDIAAFQRFAKRLSAYIQGVVSRAVHPMNASVLEGRSNHIKVIKRQAYGLRKPTISASISKLPFPLKCDETKKWIRVAIFANFKIVDSQSEAINTKSCGNSFK